MRIFSKPKPGRQMLNFENVFQNLPEATAAEIAALWKREGALADDVIEKRLQEVVYVIRDSDSGEVAGVSTAVKKKVSKLNDNFLYEFRCYIGKNFRVAGLDIKISRMTLDLLQTLAIEDADKPVGVFTILENEQLQDQPLWRRAVWPETNMYFIGYNKAGCPIRVHYFKGAKI